MSEFSKVIIVIIILLLVIVGSGIYTNNVIANDSKKLENHITVIQDNIKKLNWEDAKNELVILKEYWSQRQDKWAMLQNHFEIDNIDAALARLTDYITTETLPLALAESSVLMQYIQHIPKNSAFSIENVF